MPTPDLIHLHTDDLSVVIDPACGVPAVLHWGESLGANDLSSDAIRAALQFPIVHGGMDSIPPITLLPEAGSGWSGRPGVAGHRADGAGWAPRFQFTSATTDADADRVWAQIISDDPHEALQITSEFEIRRASGVLRTRVSLTNNAANAYQLVAVNQTLQIPPQSTDILSFSGRWSREFVEQRQRLEIGTVTIENRVGRTSHNRVPVLFSGSAGFTNEAGVVRAVHLEWSGNSVVAADKGTDLRQSMAVGELLLPGEMLLAAGDTYESPWACWAFSNEGTNGASERFHKELRSRSNHPKSARPVTLNIWEAVYFDHRHERIAALATAAASVGVERFVIDDGWFHLRRDDTAGLGDWWVDPAVWPEGLGPIAQHVTGLGVEFGLWFEPEMVNPDSDLYRAHPDWVLADHRYEPVLGRQQLVLDLGRPEVRDYLFEQISAVLSEYPIGYVKWDHNRELVQASGVGGRAGVHAQTLGFYELLRRLRAAHPTVEIESCSSGGGRIDFKVLEYTHRFWTSDCIDPLERQHIQRGYSHVFPPEYMGSHIGSGHAHTTRRAHSLSFRAATALFGHFGIEWNVLDASESDRIALTEIVAIHKQHRTLLHTGVVRRFDHPNPVVIAHGVIAQDRSEALVSFGLIAASESLVIEPFRITGLDPDGMYRVSVVPLAGGITGPARRQPDWMGAGVELPGRVLATLGLQVPAIDPEQALILHLTRL
jgi:alpha-galactosidase